MNISHLLARAILISWLFVLSTNAIQAAVVYQYSGNNFTNASAPYDTSMSVSGNFTVDSPLINVSGDITTQITNFSFFDGVNTITKADTDPCPEGFNCNVFRFDTDGSGNILNWEISLTPPLPPNIGDRGGYIFTSGVPTVSGFKSSDFGHINECTSAAFGQCLNNIQIGSASLSGLDNPGTWSVVPIPTAIWLFGSGLFGLVGVVRRKKA